MRGAIILFGAVIAGVAVQSLRSGDSVQEKLKDDLAQIEEENKREFQKAEFERNEKCRRTVQQWLEWAKGTTDEEFWYGEMPADISISVNLFRIYGQSREETISQMNERHRGLRNITSWSFVDVVGSRAIVKINSILPNGLWTDSVWCFYVDATSDSSCKVSFFSRSVEHDKRLQREIAREKEVLNDWLQAMRKGRDGIEFWNRDSSQNATRLFAVRDWEIVDTDVCGGNPFTVRISSSTRTGIPVEHLWTITLLNDRMNHDDDVKITSIEGTIER